MRLTFLWIALLMTWAGVGCSRSQDPAPSAPPSSRTPGELPLPKRAQPRLPTLKLWVGPAQITAEVAQTQEQIRAGMMFRTSMGENEGMLFVFGVPQRAAFWMKNVTVPMSCAYVDPEGAILELHDMEPGNETPIVASSSRVQFVLETPRGWFEKNGVRKGMTISTEHGGLRETLLRGGLSR